MKAIRHAAIGACNGFSASIVRIPKDVTAEMDKVPPAGIVLAGGTVFDTTSGQAAKGGGRK